MLLDHFLAFTAASTLLLLLPGPTVMMVISHALAHGRSAAAATVAGVALGDFTAMTVSLVGLGTLLATSATLFTALRWAGAIYLVILGIGLWRAPVQPDMAEPVAAAPRRLMLHAFTVTTLNPKTIVFFIAFVPQFLVRSSSVWPQLALFEATFVTLAAANAAFYCLAASAARRAICRRGIQRSLNRASGTVMVGAGVLAASMRS